MKKSILFAAIAAMSLVACNKSVEPVSLLDDQEITFNSVALTKGYVTGAVFEETTAETIYGTAANSFRDMHISAYLYPQNGANGNYFKDKTFVREDGDHLWHNNGAKIYWPMGGRLDFLAYSSGVPFAEGKVTWDEGNVAGKLVLDVDNASYIQDDILFSSAKDQALSTNANATSGTAMIFKHAQAWIEFQLKASTENLVKIQKIEMEDIYTAGVLTITGGTEASAKWDCSSKTAKTFAVPFTTGTNYHVASDFLSTNYEENRHSMLIPQQIQSAFVVTYTIEGTSNVLTYRYELPKSDWIMGKHYIYKISITPYEIIVNPSVESWETAALGEVPGTLS